MIYCIKCGKPNPDESNFCFSCGNVLIHPQEQEGKTESTQSDRIGKRELPVYITAPNARTKKKGWKKWIFLIIVIIGGIVLLNNLESFGENNPVETITERDLRQEDFTTDSAWTGLLTLTVAVIPHRDIITLTVTFEVYNNEGHVTRTETATRNNLKNGVQQNIQISFGVIEIFSSENVRWSFKGRVSLI